jgi:glycosyltransferase involved in cell wall biosynthesis
MRVLVVINSLGAGGAEFSTAELLPLLAARGVDTTFVCQERRDEGAQSQVEQMGTDVRFLVGRGWWARLRELRTLIRSIRPDVIHTMLFESDLLGRLAAVGTGVPVATSLVNVSYEDARLGDPNVRRWRLRVVQAVDSLTARFLTHGFHAITRTVATSGVRRLRIDPDRITVIPRTRTSEVFKDRDPAERSRVRSDLGIPEQDVMILTVGRQEYQKGQRYLVEAVSKLCRERSDVWLVIAGRAGNASEELAGMIGQASVPDRILVLGHRSDIPALLGAADIFAFPSLYEGLGGALLEAMAAGLPIVASDIPAIREVAGDSVLLAAPGNAGELEHQLARLCDQPSLQHALGEQARRSFDGGPTPDEVADRMAAWYRSLAG